MNGETVRLKLGDGSGATVRLVKVEATADPVRRAVRGARVTVEVNGETVTIGTGLQGMADRLAALGGSLEIDSTPGDGTTVRGWVPA